MNPEKLWEAPLSESEKDALRTVRKGATVEVDSKMGQQYTEEFTRLEKRGLVVKNFPEHEDESEYWSITENGKDAQYLKAE